MTPFRTLISDIRQHVGIPTCILDIGSRDVEQSVDFLDEFPEAEIHAFEPAKNNHRICVENATGTSIQVHKLALSNYIGKSKFYFAVENIGASSLLKPDFIPWAADQTVIEEEVDVETLDSWAKRNNVRPQVLHLDAQGAEGYIFEGAVETLKNVDLIYTEAGLQAYYEGHTMRNDIVKFLESQNFKLIRDVPDWSHETNLTFVKIK